MKIEITPISEIKSGDSAEMSRLITTDDLFVFANSSGNHNPMHPRKKTRLAGP